MADDATILGDDTASPAIHSLFDVPGAILRRARRDHETPPVLYHFTGVDGLVGILTKKTVWASLATTLNDASEIRYGMDRARDLLEGDSLKVDRSFRRMVLDALDPRSGTRRFFIDWRVFVVSFCERADQLIHWLHYGQDGIGVAIGFDAEKAAPTGFDLVPVVYSDEEQEAIFRDLFETGWRAVEKDLLPSARAGREDALLMLGAEIIANYAPLAAVTMKSPTFISEREWRLCTFDPVGLQGPPELLATLRADATYYRTVASRIVPYKIAAYDVLPISELVLGASSNVSPDDPGLTVLLTDTLGERLPRIVRSSVPVRP